MATERADFDPYVITPSAITTSNSFCISSAQTETTNIDVMDVDKVPETNCSVDDISAETVDTGAAAEVINRTDPEFNISIGSIQVDGIEKSDIVLYRDTVSVIATSSAPLLSSSTDLQSEDLPSNREDVRRSNHPGFVLPDIPPMQRILPYHIGG